MSAALREFQLCGPPCRAFRGWEWPRPVWIYPSQVRRALWRGGGGSTLFGWTWGLGSAGSLRSWWEISRKCGECDFHLGGEKLNQTDGKFQVSLGGQMRIGRAGVWFVTSGMAEPGDRSQHIPCCVPISVYGQNVWTMTERTRSGYSRPWWGSFWTGASSYQ